MLSNNFEGMGPPSESTVSADTKGGVLDNGGDWSDDETESINDL